MTTPTHPTAADVLRQACQAECGRLEMLLNAMTRDRDAEMAHRKKLQERVDELADMLTARAIELDAETAHRKHLQNQLDRAKGGAQ